MADKSLPVPNSTLTPAQSTWIVNELGRTENKLSVQMKFKKTFGRLLPDPPIDDLIRSRGEEIEELRKAHRNTIDSHEWGDPRTRMEKYKEIALKAEQGILKGIDKNGNHIIEEDLKLAADMVTRCREEQDRENKNNLELLKLYVLMNKNGFANTGGMTGAQNIPGDETTDAEISTDTDKYFTDDA